MKLRLICSNIHKRHRSISAARSLQQGLAGINRFNPSIVYTARQKTIPPAVYSGRHREPARKNIVNTDLKPDTSEEVVGPPTDGTRAKAARVGRINFNSANSSESNQETDTTVSRPDKYQLEGDLQSSFDTHPSLGNSAIINEHQDTEGEDISPHKKEGKIRKTSIEEVLNNPSSLLAQVENSFDELTVAMKRKAPGSQASPKAKKARVQLPEYEDTSSMKDENGEIIWPAPKDQTERARDFILEGAKSGKPILIVPDKDADGLTSGAILQRTLHLLGVPPELISIHHLSQKGSSIHNDTERALMAANNPFYIFILDQGSRHGPPVIDAPHKALIIDHHFANAGDFPEGAEYINASHCPPVVTASLLTYLLCGPLHPDVKEKTDWLCCMGTHGDLGPLKWRPPFPDMSPTLRKYGRSNVNDAVSLLNAPRRTAGFNVADAYAALEKAKEPKDVLKDVKLLKARAEVNAEVERCSHAPPKFSFDGRVSVQRISSEAQVHPVIATKWAGFLKSSKLELVMCANEGYLPDMVNFSCRVARDARARETPPNIIELLKEYAATVPGLMERMGESFARGHKEASGGVVPKEAFEELMLAMRIGEKPEKAEGEKKGKKDQPVQKNTLAGWVVKPKAEAKVKAEEKVA